MAFDFKSSQQTTITVALQSQILCMAILKQKNPRNGQLCMGIFWYDFGKNPKCFCNCRECEVSLLSHNASLPELKSLIVLALGVVMNLYISKSEASALSD
eukprot:Awhi_evm1s5449